MAFLLEDGMTFLKHHCTCSAIIAALCIVCLYQTWRLYQVGLTASQSSLHELTLRLHRAGSPLRVVPQRKDGFLLGAIFLTETDQGIAELQRLPIDPGKSALWTGTVVVIDDSNPDFACDTGSWAENGLRRGPLVFFGDRAIIESIRKAYEN
jgi:hypothetical protein